MCVMLNADCGLHIGRSESVAFQGKKGYEYVSNINLLGRHSTVQAV